MRYSAGLLTADSQQGHPPDRRLTMGLLAASTGYAVQFVIIFVVVLAFGWWLRRRRARR